MSENLERRRVVVRGRVQGVAFRAGTEDTARRLGVAGWVRNRSDGSVEAVFEGDADAVRRAVNFCHAGPPAARVDDLEVFEESPERLSGFGIR